MATSRAASPTDSGLIFLPQCTNASKSCPLKKTTPFVTASGDYLSVLMSLWLPRYGWTILIPLIVCAAIGVVIDERFLLIALMLLFIVVPMLMSFLYTYYMLTPEARRAVLRKEVEIRDGESLRLIYLPREKTTGGDEKSASRRMLLPIAREEERDEPEIKEIVPGPELIPWSDILRVKYTARFRVYILRGPRLNFLLIPHTSIPREELNPDVAN